MAPDIEYIMTGLYIFIATLTIILAVANMDLIGDLPWDIQLGWGLVVVMGIVAGYYFLTKPGETKEE